ncbi:MAG: hypothetical protein MN733_01660 [Nitrososphaera sp.]|nr:hypothetical protein [Nitrososphaera sp.]
MYECRKCGSNTAQWSGALCKPCWWSERNKPTEAMAEGDRKGVANAINTFCERKKKDFVIERILKNNAKRRFEAWGWSANRSVCIINEFESGILLKQFSGHRLKHTLKEDCLGRPINRYEVWE